MCRCYRHSTWMHRVVKSPRHHEGLASNTLGNKYQVYVALLGLRQQR
jgi:hypothetical protein